MKSYLLVALGIALIAAAPLTYPGPLQTHAGLGPLFALMGDTYAQQMLGPLPIGIVRFAASLGLAPAEALKLPIASAFLIGAAAMFVLGARAFGVAAGLLASTVYTLLPYRLMTAYVRGDIGESLFWGLLPALVALVVAIARRLPFANARLRLARARALGVGAALCGVMLWKLCVPFAPDPGQAQAYLFQVFSAQWGYGGGADWLAAVPLQLGVAPLGLGLVSVVTGAGRRALALTLCIALAILLSIVPVSDWWPWSLLLNVPWSLLGLAGFGLALLAARLANAQDVRSSLPLLAALVTFVFLASYPYLLASGAGYTPDHPALARYGDSAYLVDAAVPRLQAGATVSVTLLWQDIAPFDADYKVFVHAIDAQSKVWAQRDAEPLDGARPTTTWKRGELLRDPYALVIPSDAPPGLVVETGLYRADTGERLRTAGGADRVLLTPSSP